MQAEYLAAGSPNEFVTAGLAGIYRLPLPEQLCGAIEIHLLDLDVETPFVLPIDVLFNAERAHVTHFMHRANCVRFTVTRAVARRLLARRLGCEPKEVRIGHGAYGKPFVIGLGGVERVAHLPFNVSHSGCKALIVIGDPVRVLDVGVDIERCCLTLNWNEMAEVAFSPAERQAVGRASNPRRMAYAFWAAKEAVLK